jgi:hypothetical protein
MDVSVTSLLKKPATYVLGPNSPRLKKMGGLATDRREAMSRFEAGEDHSMLSWAYFD